MVQIEFRQYDPNRDRAAAHRIWREVGWLEQGKEAAWDLLLGCGRALVAEAGGEPECLVSSAPGVMRYLDEDLPLAEYTSVATSRVGRRQGLARQLLARVVAADAADGAALGRVCVFDQGFYNRVGFGTGSYEHTLAFDPATLRVAVAPRVPRRLTPDDAELMHASRLARLRGHGSANYPSPDITASAAQGPDNGFGLGYCDGPGGELTHHIWCDVGAKDVAHGPYDIVWMAYQNAEQFLELVALVKSWAEQVALVEMREPQGIQMQALLDRPFRQHWVTEKSKYENRMAAYAYWQARIHDLPRCLAQTHLPWGEARFNLWLGDPIESLLDQDAAWRGVAGDYIVTLGPDSSAEPGHDPALPTLSASVNAFTRLWLGVRPATGLAVTDDLAGPPALLEELDRILRLPTPRPDWDF